jgi:hypothetical protein
MRPLRCLVSASAVSELTESPTCLVNALTLPTGAEFCCEASSHLGGAPRPPKEALLNDPPHQTSNPPHFPPHLALDPPHYPPHFGETLGNAR